MKREDNKIVENESDIVGDEPREKIGIQLGLKGDGYYNITKTIYVLSILISPLKLQKQCAT